MKAEKLPEDYSPCGDCGFDHGYEQEEASAKHAESILKDIKILKIRPGSPPYCNVEVGGKVYQGVAMVIGPNDWDVSISDLLKKMYP